MSLKLIRSPLSLVLAGCLVTAFSAQADIVIGVAGPFTGPNATYGDQYWHGATQAAEDINAAGGINGEKIKLVQGDDACEPKQAVSVANRLVDQDKVKAVVGHFCSSSTMPASEVYNDAGVLAITPGSTNPQITERGIGNGISMLIFAGIVAGIPGALGQSFESARQGDINIIALLAVGLLAVAIIGFVVFIERGQRRIAVHYAKRQQGRKVFAAQTSHLPLKVNMAGVIPAIFASSILLFPASLGQWFGQSENMGWLADLSQAIAPGQPLNILLFSAGIIFFCYFYTALMFNPKDVAENLKKSGAFIPGIRPGEQSARYIDGVLTRLTLFGALYMTAVCLLPQFLVVAANVPFYLGGTSLLIVVVVVMDFMAQVQSHLMSHQYDSLMKKANLKGYGGGMLR